MSLALSNNTIDRFFGFIVKLDNMTKKKLISKLSESMDVNNKNIDLKSLYGAWSDERSSDEIIEDIRNSRIEKQNPILF